jgi:hypothetical protein
LIEALNAPPSHIVYDIQTTETKVNTKESRAKKVTCKSWEEAKQMKIEFEE